MPSIAGRQKFAIDEKFNISQATRRGRRDKADFSFFHHFFFLILFSLPDSSHQTTRVIASQRARVSVLHKQTGSSRFMPIIQPKDGVTSSVMRFLSYRSPMYPVS